MNYFLDFVNIFLHLDKVLKAVIDTYGTLTYILLFIVLFCETGLVVTPFLPGDSLLFAAGVFASKGSLNIYFVIILLFLAAVLGDTVNYHIGKLIGPKIFSMEKIRFLNKEHLEKTHKFYEKYGGITIILARFMPIIRTFAPFVAGIGYMSYITFLAYNVIGAFLWVVLLSLLGFFFGNLPIVKENFTLVIYAIIFISILPAVIAYLRSRLSKQA